MDSLEKVLATIPWKAVQDTTNSIIFVDSGDQETGLQIVIEGEISEDNLAAAEFIVAAINSFGGKV